MTKAEILEHFKEINFMYNNPNEHDTLSHMIDDLLDSIIADIEAARDKDKLCEYPYNRCIDILRRAGE